MNIILLSGGSGTRLWPLSNEVRSKQFLKILRADDGTHESMIQRVYRMIKKVSPQANILIATSEKQVAAIRNQLGDSVSISIEPCRKDTFPAIALAVAYLHDVMGVAADDKVVVCPVDPLVGEDYFQTLKKMFDSAPSEGVGLMGIKPLYPSEKYGYILQKDDRIEFKEKPDLETAKEYLNEGALWNGGVFAFQLSYLLKKTEELLGSSSYGELLERYVSFEKISFDYALLENERRIKIFNYSGEWKDLGTWNTLTEAMADPVSPNVILGENCQNVHVINELSIPVVALGLKDVVIAASFDGILVSDKHSSSFLKQYVPTGRPMREKKAWGEYKILDCHASPNQQKTLIKELIINPEKSVRYQKHLHRDETLIVVSGAGFLVIDGSVKPIKTGSFFHVERGQFHALKATEELHIIEVQIGEDLIEEDAEYRDYTWNN